MPLFEIASLAEIPGDSPTECDVSVFAASLSDLKSQINEIQHAVASLSSRKKGSRRGK